jgi:hypothetical protein
MTDNTKPALLDQVRDYIEALDLDRRRKLAEFCGVQPQTVRRWHKGKSVPVGRQALQLHYLLEYVGYTNHEWRETNDAVETVGRALTFRLLSDDDLVAAFNGQFCMGRIVQMLCGHKHISAESQAIIDELAAIHSWNIKSAQDKWVDLKISNKKERLIAELANKLQHLLPLVKDMSSDNWTEADRYELRDRAGRSTVFELYNTLGELCGERARQLSVAQRAKAAAAALMMTDNG